jgi:two-component system alkaline phosphatase synthesis response regulator PhoP
MGFRVLILARENEIIAELMKGLARKSHVCTLVSSEEELASSGPADILLIEAGNGLAGSSLSDLILRIRRDRLIFIILLVDKEILDEVKDEPDVQDFILKPYNPDEVSVRIERVLKKNRPREESAEYIRAGDLAIDLRQCEVTIAGKVIDLTFTEYELLKFLVRQNDRVLTREVLLNEVWGYDYFGGDRTVDVHIRRLRSKIEDATHSFIDTVRGIGYRFRIDGE